MVEPNHFFICLRRRTVPAQGGLGSWAPQISFPTGPTLATLVCFSVTPTAHLAWPIAWSLFVRAVLGSGRSSQIGSDRVGAAWPNLTHECLTTFLIDGKP